MSTSRRLLLSSVLLVAATGAHAQMFSNSTVGSGQLASESRTPGAFGAVLASGAIDLVVRQGDRDMVDLRADDNLLPLLETVVEDRRGGRTLVVRWKRGESVRTRNKVQVTVTALRLSSIAIEGAGDILVEKMESPQLTLTISGAGDMKARQLKTDELSVRIAGSGDLQAAGSAGRLSVNIAGSGDVNTLDLAADDVKVSIAGSGDAAIQANKSLHASIAGSGDVSYVGQAAMTKSVVGSGSVRRR
ncbi:MAG: head GIN domain-containing protein [Aquabacterium sp.]